MKERILSIMMLMCMTIAINAQEVKKNVYDESIDPLVQIDNAVIKAKQDNKFVICQLGGNWCPWCIKFAGFITSNQNIKKVVGDNFEYIHVNYPRHTTDETKKAQIAKLNTRLNNAARFGFPVLIVLNGEGQVIHIQDSSFLEEGQGYNEEKVLRFFNNWTPKVVK